jgi:hypothetical protein
MNTDASPSPAANITSPAAHSDAITSSGDRLCPLLRWTDPDTDEVDYYAVGQALAVVMRQGIISKAAVQYYLADELLAEVAFVMQDAPAGPGELQDWPPFDSVPGGTQLRLAATPNRQLPEKRQEAWWRLLDWPPAPPLRLPPGAQRLSLGPMLDEDLRLEWHVPFQVMGQVLLHPDRLPPLSTGTDSPGE